MGLVLTQADDAHRDASLAIWDAITGIEETTTWKQEANALMRAVGERLGCRLRDPVLDVRAPLRLATGRDG